MSETPAESHPIRFAALALLVATLLGVPLLFIGGSTSSQAAMSVVASFVAMVPAWSMISAALGCGWKRKAKYLLGSLAFVAVFDIVAQLSHWEAVVAQASGTVVNWAVPAISLYRLVIVGTGFVTIVLFAGKRPSVFWVRQQTSH